jgi:predicted amidophosphoribosyltransferase
MGMARIRRTLQLEEPVFKGTVRRAKAEPVCCSSCKTPLATTEGLGLCARCAVIAHRVATTGLPNRRLINGPSRHARRAKAGKGRIS